MDLHLSGKTAVVTGASKGIGFAVTKALVDAGAHVVAGSRTPGKQLPRLEESGQVSFVSVDLTETGEMAAVLRVAQQILDLAGGDLKKGDQFLGSPVTVALTMRGIARMCLGLTGWKDDLHQALTMVRAFDPLTQQAVNFYTYGLTIAYGVLLPDAAVVRSTAEILALAEQSGDDVTIYGAVTLRGIALIHQDGPDRQAGFELLAKMREWSLSDRFASLGLTIADIFVAKEKTRIGDLDGAVGILRDVLDGLYDSGGSVLVRVGHLGFSGSTGATRRRRGSARGGGRYG